MAFDHQGNLMPYGKISLSEQETEQEFVTNFTPAGKVRKLLWSNLGAYNRELKNLVGQGWEQWIDGSFVTAKQEPGDIDVINLIAYSEELNNTFGKNQSKMKYLFAVEPNPKSGSWADKQIDGHLIPVYPKDHPLHRRYLMDLAYWTKAFSKQEKTGYPKGFVSVLHS